MFALLHFNSARALGYVQAHAINITNSERTGDDTSLQAHLACVAFVFD